MADVLILVVEDDKGIRDLLLDRLDGYKLTFATCQREASDELQTSRFDLVLLDMRLPRTSSDMNPTNEVGLDILQEIRKRRLCKRESEMPLPVVVMTAFGSEMLSSELLVAHEADDYVPKPFGRDDALERKVARALAGEGAFARTFSASRPVMTVRVAFRPETGVVWIEGVEYGGASGGLLRALGDRFVEDLRRLRAPESFRGIIGDVLAAELGIDGKAVRTRVSTFRTRVRADFKKRLGRDLDENAIIENTRDHSGYRLNPHVVRVIAWDEISPCPGSSRSS